MSIFRFLRSLQQIFSNPNVNTVVGIIAHVSWQFRKLFNLFPFQLKLSNSIIFVEDSKCGVSALINNQGFYDYNNMSLLKKLMKDNVIFFDIGANIGSFSLVASEHDKVIIHAFEAHPKTFNRLQKNILMNRRSNIHAHNLAVSDDDGTILLTDTPGSSTTHIVSNQYQDNTLRVQSVSIDSFCKNEKVIPNVVKIDVEGFEFNVLTGFGNILRKVDVIFIEINGLSDIRDSGEKEIIKILVDSGFNGPFTYDEKDKKFGEFDISSSEDAVFLSSSFIEEVKDEFVIDSKKAFMCE